MTHYPRERFVGVHLPPELVTRALEARNVNPDELDQVKEVHGLFYLVHGKPVPAADKFDYIPEGKGTIGHYLKQDPPMSLSDAELKVTLMLTGSARREKLYTWLKVTLKNGRELAPIYVFTLVADKKDQ